MSAMGQSSAISDRRAIGRKAPMIGIGGHLAVPPLPHHRAYGSVPRRFDWVKLGQGHGVGGDRASRNSGCAGLVGPPGVRTYAKTPSESCVREVQQIVMGGGPAELRSRLASLC